ncbi:MAG: BMP family ABC transporter substrate-binding protein [Alphaproteobacteria bacterium]
METRTIRSVLWGALAIAWGLTIGGQAAVAGDPLKVGFVYVGPVGDHGWTYRHDQGRKAVEAALGDRVKTTFVENVKEGADAERVIQKLAASGHKLIFTTSFGFMNPTIKVAKRFPDVKFEHATGYKRAPNVSTYAARFYEGRTVAGVIAAKMTKSNVIGYIGSFPIPEVVRGINAFTIALRRINPAAVVKVIWVNTWYDPGKESAAAKALLDQGADILMQHTDSPAGIQIASERGVWAVGQSSDMTRFGPKVHLTAIVDDWDGYYISRVKAVLDGTWKSQDTWGGLKAGMLKLAPYNPAIPADVVALAEKTRKAIEAGALHSFQGPIRDQSGKLVVPEGKTLDDGALLSMNWYVEGVQGKLPK